MTLVTRVPRLSTVISHYSLEYPGSLRLMSMIFDDIPHTPKVSATDRLMSMIFDHTSHTMRTRMTARITLFKVPLWYLSRIRYQYALADLFIIIDINLSVADTFGVCGISSNIIDINL
jgi:hypothetical protein